MRSRRRALHRIVLLACIGFSTALPTAATATGVDVTLLTAEVMKPALSDLTGTFESATGHKLIIRYGSAGWVKNHIESGDAADVVIIQKPVAETLVDEGKIARGSIVTLARSGVAVAVHKGMPLPDITSVGALKRTLLAAKSVAYPDPAVGAASGVLFSAAIEKLGIAPEVRAKAKLMKSTFVEFAVHDDAELAVTQPMDILAVPTYTLVGWLPDELQDYKKFTWAVAITANSAEPDAARTLVQFLSSASAAEVFKKRGMEPAGSVRS